MARRSLPASEFYFLPLTVGVDALGRTVYTLAGKLVAQGVDLPAVGAVNPTADKMLRWLSGADERAQLFANMIQGAGPSFSPTLWLTSLQPHPSGLQSSDAAIWIRAQSGVDGSNADVMLLNGSGKSAFAFKPLTGQITGATGAITGGTGFTCLRTGTGHYTITFTNAFAAVPTVVVTPAGGQLLSIASVGTGSFLVNCTDRSGVQQDVNFHFIVFPTT
jgi:hypothetical protein